MSGDSPHPGLGARRGGVPCPGWVRPDSPCESGMQPRVPVAPGEENSVLDTSLDEVYFALQLLGQLTHGVMNKELKYCKNPEDLECNENVKHKTKEYIKKYMQKFGAVYKPKEDTELERKGASQELLKLQVVSQISQDAALELS